MNAPLVSIILRPNNRIRRLYQALLSIYAQTYRPLEIVIVKNGGANFELTPDKVPLDIAHHYIYNDESCKGAVVAHSGIENSSGKLILLLGSNDILYPRHIEKLVEAFNDHLVQVAYSGSNIESDILSLNNISSEDKNLDNCNQFNPNWLYFENLFQQSTVMFSRNLYYKVGGMDLSFASSEDWDLWIRFAQQVSFYRVPEITCECQQIGGPAAAGTEWQKKIYEKYRSHWSADIVLDYIQKRDNS